MTRIFYKKWTAIMFVAALLVLVLLVCLLLTSLVQMSALKDRIATFERLYEAAQTEAGDREEYLRYLQSDAYVRWWAEQQGRLKDEDLIWLKEHS